MVGYKSHAFQCFKGWPLGCGEREKKGWTFWSWKKRKERICFRELLRVSKKREKEGLPGCFRFKRFESAEYLKKKKGRVYFLV